MISQFSNSATLLAGEGLCLLCCGLLLLPPPARAQPAGAGLVEEIIVTAQKRAESIQDVGITMAAFDFDDIRRASLQDLSEVPQLVSNVELFGDYGGGGLPTWVIRGVGLQDFNANNTPTAAIYVDDVYQTSTAMGSIGLFDIERVEVLKGPQGGLYGRNTSGGAVNVVTAGPRMGADEGYLTLQYGKWETGALEGAWNLNAGEHLAFRLAGRALKSGDGWQHSLADGSTHGEKDRLDFRAAGLYTPSERLELEIKVYGGRDDSEVVLGRSVGLYSASAGLCDAVLQGRRDEENCLNWAGVNRTALGLEPRSVSLQSGDGSVVLSQPLNRHSHDYHGLTATARYRLGGLALTSVSAYDRFDYGVLLDLDSSIGEYGHRPSSSDMEVWSQELRLASPGDAPLNWLLGLSLTNDTFLEDRQFLLRDNHLVGLRRGLLSYRQFTRSRALFGQIRYELGEAWNLISDLRYTDESKDYREGSFTAPELPPPLNVFADGLSSDYELGSHFSGKLQLEWSPREDLLLYASVSRGFKAGGFYGGFPFNPQEVEPYQEETILAWEAGLKSSPVPGALFNAALFWYDYRDVQGFVTNQNEVTGTKVDLLANQGDARHLGVEVDAGWEFENGLFLNAALGWLEAEMQGLGAPTTNLLNQTLPLRGERPYAPDWNVVLSAGVERRLTNTWSLLGFLNYHYRSDFAGFQSSPADAAINRLDGYGLTNARLQLEAPQGQWLLGLWVKNLFDKAYVYRVKHDGLRSFADIYGEPRSWGMELRYRW